MPPVRTTRRHALQGLAALALAPSGAFAAVGGLPSATHDASSPEWERISGRLFPGKPLIAGQSVVQLIVPLRAAYGASVPVKIVSKLAQKPELFVRKLYVVVDKNPSPVAAVLGADGSDLCAPVRMQVPDTWLLVGMTIFSPWRNYGLGHRLLVQACSQARAAGFDRVSLIACEHNPATRLYRREGFTVVERRPILPHPLLAYASDVLLMVRTLS